ncbi:SDR family NAD(P)-dependent oxidoreductase [Nocardiopsis aegyptia]|uniref:NAD(P)-dependent dehydrogenase (Short-subunit alcohol dehydrogenase family) n=1 Tax=Nocardiopsis aegyptia TaxID=220378 RepID=A0A7Z0JD16_9ACTN|nr:SDR family NAD(P)-dependent oxidoreductase [Nocardiopsis aegyptia]NYJ36975.1 NAD(P)-dependent dehydrogenase (short-subunit alcohol dehydrogenase family) [Nocardiopsis aegyptia]
MSEHYGKHAIVTGATGGIGEAIVRSLAATGMAVTMVGRDHGRLAGASARVEAAVPGADLRHALADLSLTADVHALAERLAEGDRPDVVISNAAVSCPVGDRTPEGLQRTLATNHLAPYVLLRVLGRALDRGPARFVVVGASPTGLARVPVDLDDLHLTRPRKLGPIPSLRPFVAYGRTKNMNTMFLLSLAERLSGTGITVNGAHPGIISGTGLGREARGVERFLGTVLELNPWRRGPGSGADTPVWLATSPDVAGRTGGFYVDRTAVPTPGHTVDAARRRRLWEESARLVGMQP